MTVLSFAICFLGNNFVSAQDYRNSVASTDFDYIHDSDPSVFERLEFSGKRDYELPDKRSERELMQPAFVFVSHYRDGTSVEIAIDAAFKTEEVAEKEAKRYVPRLGKLPTSLRKGVDRLVVHRGGEDSTAFSDIGLIVVYSENATKRISTHDLEETIFHESVHASWDKQHANSEAWRRAQAQDGTFVTMYAKQKPEREDLAESALFAYTLLHHPDRIPEADAAAIKKAIPARIRFVADLIPPDEPIFYQIADGEKVEATVEAADQEQPVGANPANWICVGGDRGCMRYSSLDQINVENVTKLEKAWEYKTGELAEGKAKIIECTPLVVDGVMYLSSGLLKVIALNAATGEELWRFDPFANGKPKNPLASGGVNRGVAYWSDGQPNGQRRILHGTSNGQLFSLDAKTGILDPDFGKRGIKDLREDINRDLQGMGYGPTSAPAILDDLIIMGFSCGEGPGPSAPGDIRAFDIHTGKQVWRFHTVPRPGEFGNETWQADSWKDRGAANAWGGFSIDTQRGMVFAGLGSAAYDFYGSDRKGKNLFANCTIALDGKTGERIWHFQTLHHDIWDHDIPIYPNLVTVKHGGNSIDAVAQVTKTGYVFLFDRDTGKPLFEVKEVPVPKSNVEGEEAWPTQPVPVQPPPFCRTTMTEDDVTDIAPENRQFVLDQLKNLEWGPAFNPPSRKGTVVLPGFHGGATWSGASFDPETGLLYVNSNNQPNIVTLAKTPEGSKYAYRATGYHKFLDQEGYPGIKPPWGQLNAIDLNQGKIVWQSVLGEYPELTSRGVPQTGCENFGGTIVTAGGLVLIGGTRDEMFHAFDKRSGKLLWQTKLPAGGYATPATYAVDGKQFIVIPASGGGKLKTPTGDSIVAFALPSS